MRIQESMLLLGGDLTGRQSTGRLPFTKGGYGPFVKHSPFSEQVDLPSEQKPLRIVASGSTNDFKLRLRFHAFCNDLDIERAGKLDQGCHNGGVLIVGQNIGDKAPVDLEAIKGEDRAIIGGMMGNLVAAAPASARPPDLHIVYLHPVPAWNHPGLVLLGR